MKLYKHKHIYVYGFEFQRTKPNIGWEKCEYTLCTDHDNPNGRENREILENMLRIVYKCMPKGVKFLYEKI